MKTFKTIDYWIQVVLLIGFTIASLIALDGTFIIGYCVVGGWQIASMIVHFLSNWFSHKGSKRFNYQSLVLAITIIAILGTVINYFWVIFYVLLFTAPAMACFYAWLCYDEVYNKMKRPLAILK